MVVVHYMGRLGNQMFQYSLGRIIAESKGYNLGFNNSKDYLLPKYFPNACPIATKSNGVGSALSVGLNQPPPHNTYHHLDMDAVLKHNGIIFLIGYWQKHQHYFPSQNEIKKWFEYDDSQYARPDPDDVVVHFRLGDYVVEYGGRDCTSPRIPIGILKGLKYKKCIIVTDEPESPILDAFNCLENVFISSGSMMEDFTLMKYSRRLVLSQSTFSWWASFLGDQEEVYAPLHTSLPWPKAYWTMNPGLDEIDLIPKDNKKYHIVEV